MLTHASLSGAAGKTFDGLYEESHTIDKNHDIHDSFTVNPLLDEDGDYL